jgi:hypothetical protein
LELILRGNKQTLEKGEKGVLYLKGEKGVLYLPKKERSSRAGARVQPKHIMTTKMTNERKIENTTTITRSHLLKISPQPPLVDAVINKGVFPSFFQLFLNFPINQHHKFSLCLPRSYLLD